MVLQLAMFTQRALVGVCCVSDRSIVYYVVTSGITWLTRVLMEEGHTSAAAASGWFSLVAISDVVVFVILVIIRMRCRWRLAAPTLTPD